MATKRDLLRQIAALESMNDQLITELAYVDKLMRQIGFSDGLTSVKDTAREIIDDKEHHETKRSDDDYDVA